MGRRQNRYLRNKEKRLANREKYLKQYMTFENVSNLDALYKATMRSAKGVKWKESVQKFLASILFNISSVHDDISNGVNICLGFIHFIKCERGKNRYISSLKFREKILHTSISKNSLNPVMTYNLITDNTASQKGKGTYFAVNRVTNFLRRFYRKYGNNGYVLLIDFKGYFENIQHQPCKNNLEKYYKDKQLLKYAFDFIDAYGEKGLGLGSETSQVNAIAYINEIDHYIKEVARVKFYGRYMDDSIFLHHSKEFLQDLLVTLREKYKEYGITLSERKTQITDIKHGFTFLKTRFFVTNTGKILRKPCRQSITRERRKLKKQANLFNQGILTLEAINISFNGWLASMKPRNAKRTVASMKLLYNNLFNLKGESK